MFDRVRTCDNHCPFCFIHQLPKGMRKSLYVKDDDFRLSFLHGNYITLTDLDEAELQRIETQRLSPLYVSVHATDADEARRRGAEVILLAANLQIEPPHGVEVIPTLPA